MNLNFNYNFAALDLIKLHREDKITIDEIVYVFENSYRLSQTGESNLNESVSIQIGYTPKKRIVLVAFMYSSDTIDFIGAKVADESEVEQLFCAK